MNRKTANLIVETLQEAGIEAKLYEDYSGRGMYGRTTTAVKITDVWASKSDVQKALSDYPEHFVSEGIGSPALSSFRTDSLGLSWLLY